MAPQFKFKNELERQSYKDSLLARSDKTRRAMRIFEKDLREHGQESVSMFFNMEGTEWFRQNECSVVLEAPQLAGFVSPTI
jgi:shikimate kinase